MHQSFDDDDDDYRIVVENARNVDARMIGAADAYSPLIGSLNRYDWCSDCAVISLASCTLSSKSDWDFD